MSARSTRWGSWDRYTRSQDVNKPDSSLSQPAPSSSSHLSYSYQLNSRSSLTFTRYFQSCPDNFITDQSSKQYYRLHQIEIMMDWVDVSIIIYIYRSYILCKRGLLRLETRSWDIFHSTYLYDCVQSSFYFM